MKFSTVMIYVNNMDMVIPFWIDIMKFTLISSENSPIKQIKIQVNDQSYINFFSKEDIAKMSPELSLTTPSLMFESTDLEQDHAYLSSKGILVGDIVNIGDMKTFNFRDLDDNYFALQEA